MEKVAATEGVDGLIAGGGDGTISAAAAIAWQSGLVLGVIPAGTMNLFARTLKLPLDIWQVLEVLAKGEVEHADIASANGRSFVHQFSAGLHSRMVRYRNQMSYASRLGKMRASTRAALGVMFNPPVFEVEFTVEGRKELRKVSAISASNNEFGNDGLLYADTATGGHLGFYVADALTPAGVAALAIDILRGRLKENEAVSAMTATEVELHFSPCPKGYPLRHRRRTPAHGPGRHLENPCRRVEGAGPPASGADGSGAGARRCCCGDALTLLQIRGR